MRNVRQKKNVINRNRRRQRGASDSERVSTNMEKSLCKIEAKSVADCRKCGREMGAKLQNQADDLKKKKCKTRPTPEKNGPTAENI